MNCFKTCPDNTAYSCVFEPPNSKLLEIPAWLHLLAFEFYHCLRIQRLTWIWLMTPQCQIPLLGVNLNLRSVCLWQNIKKDTTNPKVHKQAFWEVTSRHQNYVQIFTDGSKVDEKVAAAAVSSVAPNSPFSCRLRDHCSIYTAELQAILFALKQAYQSQERKFYIFRRSEN